MIDSLVNSMTKRVFNPKGLIPIGITAVVIVGIWLLGHLAYVYSWWLFLPYLDKQFPDPFKQQFPNLLSPPNVIEEFFAALINLAALFIFLVAVALPIVVIFFLLTKPASGNGQKVK